MSEQNILATIGEITITEADVDSFIRTLPSQQQAYARTPSLGNGVWSSW